MDTMITTETAQVNLSAIAEQADREQPPFSLEFLHAMVDTGREALVKWLQENDAPAEVVDLVEKLDLVWLDISLQSAGRVNRCPEATADTIAALSHLIPQVGGGFHTAGCYITRLD